MKTLRDVQAGMAWRRAGFIEGFAYGFGFAAVLYLLFLST